MKLKTPQQNILFTKNKITTDSKVDVLSRENIFSDYDYQDKDSYEQPYRNPDRGYEPIDADHTIQPTVVEKDN
ncbi:MAG: hypothetical protein H7328_03125 [Bdellovibrio sp.]|nr:hypothetical protein [Bdellovibrio sp.]